MYLVKLANSVYYTRVCFPKAFVRNGYPYDIKVSLMTKDRATGVIRNLQIAAIIKESIQVEKHNKHPDPTLFRQFLDSAINQFRQQNFKSSEYAISSMMRPSKPHVKANTSEAPYRPDTPDPATCIDEPCITVFSALNEFIETKKHANVTNLTVHQLKQRISHFISFLGRPEEPVSHVSKRHVIMYVEQLNKSKRSAKTNKEYFASVKQFIAWCYAMDYLPENPAQAVKPHFKSVKLHASEERKRWSHGELERLFSSKEYQRESIDFQWTTLLLLFHGLRPNEACQLRTSDIHVDDLGNMYLNITDAGELQHLKNKHAVRKVPIHKHLLSLGFASFCCDRRKAGKNQLFNFTPYTLDNDWSKAYRTRLGKLQTSIGFKAGDRPTAYSFRHTFIDELKKADVPEYEVAEIVGHVNSNMTYGRYGKKLDLNRLVQTINSMPRIATATWNPSSCIQVD